MFVLALVDASLSEGKGEVVAYHNLIGQRCCRDEGQSLEEAARQTYEIFLKKPALAGLTPQQCHLSPTDAATFPTELRVNGSSLPVVPNQYLRKDQIWICCPEVDDE